MSENADHKQITDENKSTNPITARLMMDNDSDDNSVFFSDEFFAPAEETINKLEIVSSESQLLKSAELELTPQSKPGSREIMTRDEIAEIFRQLSQIERPPVLKTVTTDSKDDSSRMKRRNDFVAFVFQMCLVVFNAVGSIIYVTVVFLYMMSL